MIKRNVEALFISDVHLGSKGSNAKQLLETLKHYKPKQLFIVGDFIDGWLLKRRHYWKQEYTDVLRKILSYSKKGTKVTYITGNHDEFLRLYGSIDFGKSIKITDETIWNGYYITHGDKFDGVIKLKWLGILGSVGYEIAIAIDRTMKQLGYKYSFSKYVKNKVKSAVKFMTDFENQLVYQARKRDCKGVICGHIHSAENKFIDGIHYLNCGDWIENNTYIVYNENKFEIRSYGNIHTAVGPIQSTT
jgi:UDP-2,3-diacylglucosamine pyrophosphatase LpxH